MRSRLLCVCMCLFVVAGCRSASTPDGGERQKTSVAAVRYSGGVAEWFRERIAGLIVTVEAVGLLDCVIISGDHVS